MFSPRASGGSRGGFSPYVSKGSRSAASGRRSVSLFTPQKRSPFARSKPSHNRSLQSSLLIDDTSQQRVESYGTSLPVLITETLTQVDRTADVSVKIDPSGWAWLVVGRKLFVWRYKPTQFGKAGQCKELVLPPSGLSHSSELVCILPASQEQQSTSCIAVSPEGIIRYWSNIVHEGAFLEVSADLAGNECASLVNVEPFGCILATTTSNLQLVSHDPSQNSVNVRSLATPQGMLAGIGRRMSSFIFGGAPQQLTNESLVRVLAGETCGGSGIALYLMTEKHLQKWLLSDGESEKLLFQCEVDNLLRECLSQMVWSQDLDDLPNLRTWLLDMQLTSNGVVILAAGLDTDFSPQVQFVCATLETRGLEEPQSFSSFAVSSYSIDYKNKDYDIICHQLLIPDISCEMGYLYTDKAIVCQPVNRTSPTLDKVEFLAAGEKLIGAGSCEGLALFFSNTHGLVSVSSPKDEISIVSESFAEPASRNESTMAIHASKGLAELSMSEDNQQRLKAAFLHSCRGNKDQAQAIVDELFPPSSPVPTQPGSTLDRMVATLSQELIDDFPVADPRWAESLPQDSASTTESLIILHQIEDKQRAHDFLLSFLKNVGLWDRLTCVMVRELSMATRLLLCEHAEKLIAAHTLRESHTQCSTEVDSVIGWILSNRPGSEPGSGLLTPQDLFYREVSKLDDVIEGFLQYEDQQMAHTDVKAFITIVTNVNNILVAMLNNAVQYRQSKDLIFQSQNAVAKDPEYLPWTASCGPAGVRTLLSKQYLVTCGQAIPAAEDTQTRGLLFQQLLSLADILLDGYKCQLESVRQNEGESKRYKDLLQKYEHDRQKFISPFLDNEQLERAASLAEKYCDFATLVKLCDSTNNQDRLQRYMHQFANKGFSDFVFKFYMDEGKRGKLLSQPILNQQGELREFLQTDNNRYLSWLHEIHTGNFSQAHLSLKELALLEEDSLHRKKTLLSLSKLSALASETDQDVEDTVQAINEEHTLILHQEALPAKVIESLGLDPDVMRVFSPKELIELYISSDNEEANEYDFKKALDLLPFVQHVDPEADLEALQLHIWCQAVMRNDWSHIETNDPLENNRDTVFFKVVELAFIDGADLLDFLPSVDELLNAEELGALREDASFQYLVRAGYEHIMRTIA